MSREMPKDAHWTNEQWEAISRKGKHMLVAAAAGSGKTAVLVERIIQKITDVNEPVDIDRLLVVTFTNAAASEMRKRIGEALDHALKDQVHSAHLRRQFMLLNRASISTLHSFCLNVLRKYYYKIDLDPKFRIANETEIELLKEEIIADLFEEQYGIENNEPFFDLVDRYSSDRNDVELQMLILKLYQFSMSHPFPFDWLDEMVNVYDTGDQTTLDGLPFVSEIKDDIFLQFEGCIEQMRLAIQLSKHSNGPSAYTKMLEEEIEPMIRCYELNNLAWSELKEQIHAIAFGRLPSIKKADDVDEEIKKEVQSLRNHVKKMISSINDTYFARNEQSYLKDLRELKPVLSMLISLVKQFHNRFHLAKKERCIVDFNDLEHKCLHILLDPSSTFDRRIPSEIAKLYQEQFDEILVDEYQDVNFVQEAIIRAICKDGEKVGNLFMVGDVKQSIYRFRLAEPTLFIHKYEAFTKEGATNGVAIDLNRNFRSRSQVLDCTNFIFRQLLDKTVGEMEYDDQAELKLGASYPENDQLKTNVVLIDRNAESLEDSEDEEGEDQAELESMQLEARYIAKKIQELIGTSSDQPMKIYDRKLGGMREITYRDIVILSRATQSIAPIFLEEFKQHGIPAYAELSSGYFEATEVSIMLNVLRIIDNPYQDIPLVSVLRSPIVQLTGEELANIRIHSKATNYYEAMKEYIDLKSEEDTLVRKIRPFLIRLDNYRVISKSVSLAELIWKLYQDTGYYDFVGGMPSGVQRQANLRALYDRARNYEQTSFRGLFRFLRFIERMQERGDDLGTARALGEQEDVVRMMTIHKSKGLEFPVVFVAGMNRGFNFRDVQKNFLMHKELGFGTKYINPTLRITYTTLPYLAIKRRLQMELLAEEMRVLYVALTRAKEQLYLVGTVKKFENERKHWLLALTSHKWLLPSFYRSQVKTYLGWIAPALMRHHQGSTLRLDALTDQSSEWYNDPSQWDIQLIDAKELYDIDVQKDTHHEWLSYIETKQPIPCKSKWKAQVEQQLTFQYPFEQATIRLAKQSVTELKRQKEYLGQDGGISIMNQKLAPIVKRPRFMQKQKVAPNERGTIMHTVMQHVPLDSALSVEELQAFLDALVVKEILTEDQIKAVELEEITHFFTSELGQRMIKQRETVEREIPFSFALEAKEVYPSFEGEEKILIQGVIDCLFKEDDHYVLVDYKTDRLQERFKGGFTEAKPILENRYRLQLELYKRAVETIWDKRIKDCYLYFFDGGYIISI